MKKVLLWLVMVLFFLALILGGTIGAMYYMVGEDDLPAASLPFAETELTPTGYEWSLPVLGGVLSKDYAQPTNLTVQKLGSLGAALPTLTLPEWATRSDVRLVAPDGSTVLQGDAAAFNAYTYTQNGQYQLLLTLYGDGEKSTPATADGWYKYSASYQIMIEPQLLLSSQRAAQGSVVALTVTGILDGSTPSAQTDLGTVWFRPTAEGWMGYVPITYNAESGAHTITVTCGELVQQAELTVTAAAADTVQLSAGQAAGDTPAGSQTEFQNAIWPLYTSAKGEKLWSGRFAAPTTAGIARAYGSILMVDGTRAGRETGIVYAAEAGSAVTATQNGTIAYAGTLGLTGGTVVIDHGCGVKSYLFGLETVTAQRGQTVAVGDAVGTASAQHALIFEMRIGNKSVDPSAAIGGSSGLQYKENL